MSILTEWPQCDAELVGRITAATETDCHRWMCACAEDTLGLCDTLHVAAGFALPEPTTIELKRAWLAGSATDDDLACAQRYAVNDCYHGHCLALGAALLGCLWHPGSGASLSEDEHYAESMTWYPDARAALLDILRECWRAVVGMVLETPGSTAQDVAAAEVRVQARQRGIILG